MNRKVIQKKRSKRRLSKRKKSKSKCSKQKGGSGYTFNLSVCNPPGGLMEVVRYETCKDAGQNGGKRRKSRRKNVNKKNKRKTNKRLNKKRSNRKQRKQRGGNNCSNCNVVNRNLGCKQPEWTPDCI